MNKVIILILASLSAMLTQSCNDEDVIPFNDTFDPDYNVLINPDNFVNTIDNSFLPLIAGSTFTYIGETEDGIERVEIEVLTETKIVSGITCTVVLDRAYLNNELIEETYDWFAQDIHGNVWYFGEYVDNYINGVVANHDGSWETGVDGAEPGFVMLGNPLIGLHYRQEFYRGEAEDRGEVVSTNETVTVAAGTFTNCIKIRETNALDPDFLEFKYYAPGVGQVKVEVIDEPVEIEELTAFDING